MGETLTALAEAAGIEPTWRDVYGTVHTVAPHTLRAVLDALGVEAVTPREAHEKLADLQAETTALNPMITATLGISITGFSGKWKIELEGGGAMEGVGTIPGIAVAGYHQLESEAGSAIIAVAPPTCHSLPSGRPWGLAVQLYSLRRDGDGGIGDFGALRNFVGHAAAKGADAVAISPVHAQFSADPERFSPYAPSSRIMLNVLHADSPVAQPALEAEKLVDWPEAARARLAAFRAQFAANIGMEEFAAFRAEMGEPLEAHARFEALHAHMFGRDLSKWHWRSWDEAYRHPASPAVAAFARDHAEDVSFHAYLQFLADRGLASAQAAARAAGMRIGLISDLAVGTDGGGSHAWSRQDETLIGLTVGAPPDLLSPQGQDWGLTTFSPRGLQRHGYGAFIEMLRAALRHAGGVRIDHVMGLQRLWVRPEGAAPGEGAYIRFPVTDLLRLVALESHRHQAVVLGEDLGTVPEGFSERLAEAGLLGMRVLWFERDAHSFKSPRAWTPTAVGMTSTHDLSTVAGWWAGRDLQWRRDLNLLGDEQSAWFEHENRDHDRNRLWEAFVASESATGEMPAPGNPALAADAAAVHVGGAACELVLLPIEDALGRAEQPNLPGTMAEHPNWRHRLDGPAETLLDPPDVSARLAALAAARSAS